MTDKFIKIINNHIDGRGYHLNVKELYVLSYLKYHSEGRNSFRFRMSDFIDFVNSKEDTYVQYSGKKNKSKVMRLKDKRSLAPILNSLVGLKLLQVDKGINFEHLNVNKLIQIKLLERECDTTDFESINCKLIEDLFPNLGYNGFGLFCFLKKNHFIKELSTGSCSYAISEISKYIGIDPKTISAYTELLIKYKLIKFKSSYEANQKAYAISKKDNTEANLESNYYEVYSKYDTSNKYFVKYSKP